MSDLLVTTSAGLYCPSGDFYVDPWQAVPSAIITHAHSDHATGGSARYLTAVDGAKILSARLGSEARIQAVGYGEPIRIRDVTVSLHPAGHILGSSQVRIERGGEVWVVTGDYKIAFDTTCLPFELVQCHTLITESTFGLPIYRWQHPSRTFAEINSWWMANQSAKIASVLFSYSLGKAQRLLSGIDRSIGPVYCHGAVERLNQIYRDSGVPLPETVYVGDVSAQASWAGSIIIAPTSARGTPWLRRFGDHSSAYVSGWMQIRGARRRRSVDRGFTLSDHADWPALLEVIRSSGAERVLVTHGFVDPMVRWLNDNGWQAAPLHTEFRGELDETSEPITTNPEGSDS